MKITPGPWRVREGFERPEIVSHDGYNISVVLIGLGEPETQANARAIAEVPAMIAYIQRVINAHSPSCTTDLVNTAKAILSRIEGPTQ